MFSLRQSNIIRAAVPSRWIRPATPIRNYAKQNMSAEGGQASPGTASNVYNPGSASAEERNMKQSRGVTSDAPDTQSTASPVTNPTGAKTGQQGDDSSAQQTTKQDPDKSSSEKRKNVEEMGQKPLDPANK